MLSVFITTCVLQAGIAQTVAFIYLYQQQKVRQQHRSKNQAKYPKHGDADNYADNGD